MPAKRPPALDRIDIRILAALQRSGRMTVQKLASQVGLTPRPCLERVRRLEAAGIIAGYQAVLALERLSNPVTIFAEIVLEKQGRQDRLEKRLAGIEEVVECWEVSGDLDYLARFVCSDLGRYETLTTDLIDDPDLAVARIVSHIALRPVRRFTGYPLSLLNPAPWPLRKT
jgi:Lrp/AsnC family leucine-responsive transcriptional regulator